MTTGKWCLPDVPHRGWRCVDVQDLGEPAAVCEMCEVQVIRYVHEMEHTDYPDALKVGCVCAEHMEQDTVGPRLRERALKNAAVRRRKWISRAGWQLSRKGNPYIRANGFLVTVYPIGDAWRFWLKRQSLEEEEKSWPSRHSYPSEEAAKLAAFDAITWLKTRMKK